MKSLFLLLLSFLSFPIQPEKTITAKEIIQKLDQNLYGNTSFGKYEITIVKPRITRTIEIDFWDDRKNKKSFIRILKPKKDEGITFLKDDKNLWQFIPKIGKEIKIEGSLMQDSWMGSDFTNDDLVKSNSYTTDYVQKFINSNNKENWKVELIPNQNSAIIWKKVEIEIRKSDNLPVTYIFYDHKDRVSKVLSFSDYKIMGGRFIPTIMKMNSLKDGEETSKTTLVYKDVQFDISISSQIFSKANLRKSR